jgi:hypothetical protein
MLAGLYCVPALFIGNIYGMLGVGLVLAMRRHPETWAYLLVTKVTPAGVNGHVAVPTGGQLKVPTLR